MNKLAIAWGPDLYYNLQKEEETYNNNVAANNDDTNMTLDNDDNNFICPLIPTNDIHGRIMEIDMLTSICRETDIKLAPGFY